MIWLIIEIPGIALYGADTVAAAATTIPDVVS